MQALLFNKIFKISFNLAQMSFINDTSLAAGVLSFSRNFVNSYASLFPILFLSVIIIILWCISSIKEISIHKVKWILCFLYLSMLGFYGLSSTFVMNYSIFGTVVAANWYVWFANLAILSFALLNIWLRNMSLTLLLYAGGIVIFGLILVASVDIITFYVSFEALSLLTYGIIATNKTLGSSEGALKYFIYGVISSVLLIFGLSIYYITYQSTDWYEIYMYETFQGLGIDSNSFALLSIVLVVLAFCYKMSVFPFHFALPDVYEGASWETISIINLAVKLILTFSLFRVWGFLVSQFELTINISVLLLIAAILSLIIGCFGALVQTSLKRLFAYTSINQSGFILLGLLTNDVIGLQASLIYLVTYMLTMFVFFTGVTMDGSNLNNLLELRRSSIVSKCLIALSLFSMAGIPPFFGFISKYWIWISLINGTTKEINGVYLMLLWSAFIVSIVVSLVGAYYYLRLIKVYMFDANEIEVKLEMSQLCSIGVILSFVIILFLMVGWLGLAEEIANLFKFWAIDNYGSWVDNLQTGRYIEWLRS